ARVGTIQATMERHSRYARPARRGNRWRRACHASRWALYKIPKPDYVLALHDGSDLPAGKVGWHEGSILAGANSVDITVRGYGGHGAAPQRAKDPILIASEIVVALQTIVSREMDPQVPTVVTV